MVSHQTHLKDSVATNLLKVIFGIYFVIALIVTLVQMGLEYNHNEEIVLDEIEALPKFLEPQIANALWTVNYQQIRFTLVGMRKNQSLTGVRIEDEQGNQIYTIGQVIDQEGKVASYDDEGVLISTETDQSLFSKLTAFEFPIQINKDGELKNMGKWVIFSNRQVVIDRVQYGFILILINSVIKTVVLWVTFIICARSILGRPLTLLTSTVEKVDFSNLENHKIKLNISKRNEFKILEEAFNSMIEKLLQARDLLEKTNAELDEKVKQRTQELVDSNLKIEKSHQQLEQQHLELQQAQSQLVQSEKMASLGVLTAGVAHEINNPTNFIHSGAQNLEKRLQQLRDFIFELAEEDSQEEMQQIFEPKLIPIFQNLEAIQSGSVRIRDIVVGLRTFSRLDESEQKKADVIEGLQSTLALVKSRFSDHIEFVCEFEPVPMIECWPAQLNQVFMNIMINGCQAILTKIKQSKEKIKGTLTIRVFNQNTSLIISFQDTGTGIPKEIQNKIFDPFFTTKAIGDGTGLGLSISFGIIEKHDGTITVESQEEKGTIFTITLPQTSRLGKN